MLGRIPVATPMLRKLWRPIQAPIPAAMTLPWESTALAAIMKHLKVMMKMSRTTAQQPIKPKVSPITVKIKSVCDSEINPVLSSELISCPRPMICPDPIAVIELIV